jgi:hypothetical protein
MMLTRFDIGVDIIKNGEISDSSSETPIFLHQIPAPFSANSHRLFAAPTSPSPNIILMIPRRQILPHMPLLTMCAEEGVEAIEAQPSRQDPNFFFWREMLKLT